MTKILLLLLGIFIGVSHAQDFSSIERDEHYFQILLKKWQENTDRRELRLVDSVKWKYDKYEIITKALRKHYGLVSKRFAYTVIKGEQNEYLMVRLKHLPTNNEQIWFLFSRINGQFLSTYKDIIKPVMKNISPVRISIEDSSIRWKQGRENDAEFFYELLLKQWKSDSIKEHWRHRFSWNLPLDNIPCQNKNVDSSTAITIAIMVAEKYYSHRMTPLGANNIGNNNEHWLVFCFQTIQDYRKQEACSKELASCYKTGCFRGRIVFANLMHCPETVVVLISKENGQVLAVNKYGFIIY